MKLLGFMSLAPALIQRYGVNSKTVTDKRTCLVGRKGRPLALAWRQNQTTSTVTRSLVLRGSEIASRKNSFTFKNN